MRQEQEGPSGPPIAPGGCQTDGPASDSASARRKHPTRSPSQSTVIEDLPRETGVTYTIFSDSTAAINRVMMDQRGPGQALARTVELGDLLGRRGCSVTLRWTPAHKGVVRN